MEPSTWANGFGIWHASVPATEDRLNDANKARRLIIAELAEREGPNFDPRTVHVTRAYAESGRVVYQEVTT